MEVAEYKNIFKNEGSHFFYVASHDLILSLVNRYKNNLSQIKNLRILDAGCGTGLLAKKLEQHGVVWGIDISPHAIYFSKKRGIKALRGSITKLPLKDNSFDIILCIDVLYHKAVRSDIKALQEFFRVLKPKGILIIRVPAHPWLKLIHDSYVHTRERYKKEELKNKLLSCGFKVEKLTYVNALLFVFAVIRFLLEKILPKKSHSSIITRTPAFVNYLLLKSLQSEISLLKRFTLPVGLELLAVCHKPLSH